MDATNKQILLSYRRGDSDDMFGRIYDFLRVNFGAHAVSPSGASSTSSLVTPGSIEEALDHCAVLVVLVGPRWLAGAAPGVSWIENAQDATRREITSALQRQIPILLVLEQGASSPSPQVMPPDMLHLLADPGLLVRDDPDFRSDMQRLVERLQRSVRVLPPDLQVGATITGRPAWNAALTHVGILFLSYIAVTVIVLVVGSLLGLITVGSTAPLSAQLKQEQSVSIVILTVAAILIYGVTVFLAGRAAAFRTGQVSRGNFAGLFFGLITSIFVVVFETVVPILSNKTTSNSPAAAADQALTIAILVLVGIALILVNVGFCTMLGLLGGLLGSWQRSRRIQAIQRAPAATMPRR